jgi:hypothetical protein
MGLGDRDGKESLTVAGHLGVGIAPADGANFDELLFRAEGRATTSVAPCSATP